MKASPYYFEIKDLLTQFVTAFDDIVIKRFNKDRKVEDRISVRYLYSPKQRVLYDIINLQKNITIPAVAVNVTGISRDNSRVFNKLEGFYYGTNKSSAKLRSPVPVNIDLSVSIISRFQSDMDQIISNFVPYTNPYVVISWKVPNEFSLPEVQEIRSEVLWNGDIKIDYPTDLAGNEKARIIAETSFTIKGWLFKEADNNLIDNIYYIKENFYAENLITYYEDLTGNSFTFPTSSGLINELEYLELSGTPTISNIFYNGVLMETNYTLTPFVTGTIMLYGQNYTKLKGLLLSATNPNLYSSNATLTSVGGFTRQTSINGQIIPYYNVINDNILTFNLPILQRNLRYPVGKIVIVPFNEAGYSTSAQTHLSALQPTDTYFITR